MLRQQRQGRGEEEAFLEKGRFLQGIETPSPVDESGGDTPSPSDVGDENGERTRKSVGSTIKRPMCSAKVSRGFTYHSVAAQCMASAALLRDARVSLT